MLRQTLVLQHVHQRGLARVVQALWCEEEGKVSPPFARAPDPIRLVGSKERWVLAERRAREARREGAPGGRTHQEQDLGVLLPQPEGSENVVELVHEEGRHRYPA